MHKHFKIVAIVINSWRWNVLIFFFFFFFFEDNARKAVTVNGERYWTMIKQFFCLNYKIFLSITCDLRNIDGIAPVSFLDRVKCPFDDYHLYTFGCRDIKSAINKVFKIEIKRCCTNYILLFKFFPKGYTCVSKAVAIIYIFK